MAVLEACDYVLIIWCTLLGYIHILIDKPMYITLELGRYLYLESVSVFGIFVGIFFMSVRYSVMVFWNTLVFGIGISEILVENRKFLVPPPLFDGNWRPCWEWPMGRPRRNFTVFWKTRMIGHQAMKKFDSKFGRFDTSTWQTDGQVDTASVLHNSKHRAMDCVAR